MANRHVAKPTVVIDMKTLEVISFIAPEDLDHRIVEEGEIPHRSTASLVRAIQTAIDYADAAVSRGTITIFDRYELVLPLVPSPSPVNAIKSTPVYLVDLASGEFLMYPSPRIAEKLNGIRRGSVSESCRRSGFPYMSRYSAYTDQELMDEFLKYWYNEMTTKKPLFLRKPNRMAYRMSGWKLHDIRTGTLLGKGSDYQSLLNALEEHNVHTTMRAVVSQAYAVRANGKTSFIPKNCPADTPMRVTYSYVKLTQPKGE